MLLDASGSSLPASFSDWEALDEAAARLLHLLDGRVKHATTSEPFRSSLSASG